jgi:hypothetical protein
MIDTTRLKILLARRVSIPPAAMCDGTIAVHTGAHKGLSRRYTC